MLIASTLAFFMAFNFETAQRAPSSTAQQTAHVFYYGQPITIATPENLSQTMIRVRAANERGESIQLSLAMGGKAQFKDLPEGWYRIEFFDEKGKVHGFTAAAVLEPLTDRPPDDSPIAIDIALAWLGEEDQSDWPLYAELARLAGVRWVRDRIHWCEMQPKEGPFLDHTKYDDSAALQNAEGLQILQVFHTRPKWALDPESNPERPRLDLAKLYAFCKGMAERFHGKVQAWEPWNEGNAANFGGLTIDELCTLQKAAYLGFKAGDPDLTVCWNPLGGINIESQTQSILRNETWPYFDIYSIHSYDWPHGYEDYWKHARDAASGRPLWVTECDRGMQADPDSPIGDFTPEDDIRKAEFIAQSYVRSLFAGSTCHFHFILGHYMEGNQKTQFGLLREDHTPRPGYVALANLGRRLAGATCLGRYEVENQPNIHCYAFRAQANGESKDVLVAWTEREGDWPARGNERAPWPITETLQIEKAYDYLGRSLEAKPPAELRPDPVFLQLPAGELDKLPWRTVAPTPHRDGDASPVVLQFSANNLQPVQRTIGWSPEAAYEFKPDTTLNATLTVYNLGNKPVEGTIATDGLPTGWKAEPETRPITLAPLAQQTLPLTITLTEEAVTEDIWLEFNGKFDNAGTPTLSIWSRKPPAE